jgi:hypothetical protein
MAAPKVYADFHNLDDSNRVRLTCAGTLADLSRQEIELREGLRLALYMDDADDNGQPDELLVEGAAQYCPEEQLWVVSVDWDTVRYASEEGKQVPPPSSGINGAQPQDAATTKLQS